MKFEDGKEIRLTGILHRDLRTSEEVYSIQIKELCSWVNDKVSVIELREALDPAFHIEQTLGRVKTNLLEISQKLEEVEKLYEQEFS